MHFKFCISKEDENSDSEIDQKNGKKSSQNDQIIIANEILLDYTASFTDIDLR
jgi:hypothetical protein